MTLFNPCIRSIGPKDARVVLVGEAPGAQEEIAGIPFIGASGQHLDEMLAKAGILRREVYLTNVLFTRPPDNRFEAFLVGKKELPSSYSRPPVRQGRYLHPDLLCEVERLERELLEIKPNLIITAGGPAYWAVTGNSGINKARGAVQSCKWGKVLPTLHPATILYDWSNQVLIQADLIKAGHEQHFPEIRRPQRFIHTDPTMEDLREWEALCVAAPSLAVDTETKGGCISVIGFSPSPDTAYIVPFYDDRKANKTYWSPSEEAKVRQIVNHILSSPTPKILQNGLYDFQYLVKERFHVNNALHDTMILHHSMFPELLKGLAFLGSLYTNEASWKIMRQRGEDQLKKEDE